MKIILSVVLVLILAGFAFGTTIEFGGGAESENEFFFTVASMGVAFSLNDALAVTAQSNTFVNTPLVMGLIGMRYSFGDSKSAIRPFAGADGGFMTSSTGSLFPVVGLNGGVNMTMGMFGFYVKTAYRFVFGDYTAQLAEFIGGLTLNF